jgi:acetylornithine/succinyldiaminopimelate/putrescine aminotransferase
MERKLLINATHETVVRLLPALNITDEQAEEGCGVLKEVLEEMADDAG